MIASYQISEISLRYHNYVNYIKSLLAVMIKKVLRVYLTHSVLNSCRTQVPQSTDQQKALKRDCIYNIDILF